MSAEGDKIERTLEGAAERVMRKLQLRAWQALTSATPVDTGHARSSWTPTLGSPAANVLRIPADRKLAKREARQRRKANLSKAQKIATSYKLSQGPVFLTNAAPHIIYLNAGSSSQAPTNFVERAINKALRNLGRGKNPS